MLPLSSCRPTLEKRAARPREAASGVFPWEWVLACVVLIVQERQKPGEPRAAARPRHLGPQCTGGLVLCSRMTFQRHFASGWERRKPAIVLCCRYTGSWQPLHYFQLLLTRTRHKGEKVAHAAASFHACLQKKLKALMKLSHEHEFLLFCSIDFVLEGSFKEDSSAPELKVM